ncbi:MAG: TetM/TetW/TetO/TetS family tetracycline resistance ribosomal protection protein [Bacteroidales bacterium]|nr:TetM/TetW/TetO/TetS family tetracycline resistance ribosomal protection protein [Bacteroidales bacterium]
MPTNNIRNIALLAHVDAGKTSLSEQMLFLSGKIRKAGSVDKGNTQTDTLEIEKQRGITVVSSITTFDWKNTSINLIDTPGHIDFSSEAEKSLLAIDAAVIVLSASEGIQAQTEHMIDACLTLGIPFFFFVIKIDRLGADTQLITQELREELNLNVFALHSVENEASEQVKLLNLWTPEKYSKQTKIIENIIEHDDHLLNRYLEGEIPSLLQLNEALKKLIHRSKLHPLFIGSAKLGIGIESLLDAIVQYLAEPTVKSELSAIVFKVQHIKGEGRLAAVRVIGGKIKSRSLIFNASKGVEEKVGLIKNTDLQSPQIISECSAGEIAWLQGLNSAVPGDWLGSIPKKFEVLANEEALLLVQVIPEQTAQINALIDALNILNIEDPNLNFQYSKEEQELHIQIRGNIQKEILEDQILNRFGIAVQFSEPSVIYKETPTKTAEGYVRYWLPKPCWSIMRFLIEPAERGSGVLFESKVGVNDIKQNYQNDVKKAIPDALKQGILGWQVDDLKITLIEGEDHEAHTKSNDFTIATPMGIMDGLNQSEPSLLEPLMRFKIAAPEAYLGAIAGELSQLRAQIQTHQIEKGKCKLIGIIPLSNVIDFPIKLSSITGGKGKLTIRFSHYDLCPIELGQTRAYKGISPLDTAKYILKARKALS